MNQRPTGTTLITQLILCVCLVGACVVWASPEAVALTGAQYDAAIAGVDAFLDRQMDRFTPVPNDYPAQFSDAQLIQSYDVPVADPLFASIYHRADIYDTALAAIYYTRRGNLDRARRLLDGIRFVQQNDPVKDPGDASIGDGRLRTSYWANDLLAPDRASPSIDTPDAAIGNVAWAGIALTHYYNVTGQQAYLDAAKRAAEWIDNHARQSDADGFGGFSLGLDGTNAPILGSTLIRATEHNIDTYALAMNLAVLDDDPRWSAMTQRAQQFVQAMFNNQSSEEKYWTGTKPGVGGPIEINHFPVPTDAQTWGALVGVDTADRHEQALRRVSDTPANDPTGLIVIDDLSDGRTYQGVRFSNGGQHIQVENMAGYALAIAAGIDDGWLTEQPGDAPGRWGDELAGLIDQLDAIRTTADGSDPAGVGLVATPWPAGAATGFGSDYPNLRHVASTVWTGLALLASHPDANIRDPAANPLAALVPRLTGDLNGDGFVGIVDLNIVLGNWNQSVPPGDLLAGDPSGDGFVGIEDLNAVLGDWNTGTPPSIELPPSIPEPASVGFTVFGLLGLIGYQRRLVSNRLRVPEPT